MTRSIKVAHKAVKVGDLDIFYREAGPKDAPALLLLHGFPTSSQMFRNLIPALADKYHVVAPDYPGYGHSSMPTHDKFAYTFDNLARVIDEFTAKLGLAKYALYVQDYGAPVGYRLAVAHPDRITAIVVQNGNAYDEGLDNDFWKPIKAYWKEPTSKEKRDAIRNLVTYEATRWQYMTGAKNPELVSPDGAAHDQFLLDRKGNDETSDIAFTPAVKAIQERKGSQRKTSGWRDNSDLGTKPLIKEKGHESASERYRVSHDRPAERCFERK